MTQLELRLVETASITIEHWVCCRRDESYCGLDITSAIQPFCDPDNYEVECVVCEDVMRSVPDDWCPVLNAPCHQ